MYKIEKGVSIKDTAERRSHVFSQMDVGDSFEFPSDDVTRVRSAAYQYAYRAKRGIKFSIRKVSDESHRCWRVK